MSQPNRNTDKLTSCKVATKFTHSPNAHARESPKELQLEKPWEIFLAPSQQRVPCFPFISRYYKGRNVFKQGLLKLKQINLQNKQTNPNVQVPRITTAGYSHAVLKHLYRSPTSLIAPPEKRQRKGMAFSVRILRLFVLARRAGRRESLSSVWIAAC